MDVSLSELRELVMDREKKKNNIQNQLHFYIVKPYEIEINK